MPRGTSPAVKAPKSASDFAAPQTRQSPYRYDTARKGAPFGKGKVVRGVRVARRDSESDVPTLLYVSGDSITPASQLAHIGAAIQHGEITREEIEYLWSL